MAGSGRRDGAGRATPLPSICPPIKPSPAPRSHGGFAPGSRALALIHTRPGSALLLLPRFPSSGSLLEAPLAFSGMLLRAIHMFGAAKQSPLGLRTSLGPWPSLRQPEYALPPRVIAVSPSLTSTSHRPRSRLPCCCAIPFIPGRPMNPHLTTPPNPLPHPPHIPTVIIHQPGPRANICHPPHNHPAAL